MSETEYQRQADMSWMRYWTESLTVGEQSRQGHEEAPGARIDLRKHAETYDQRVGVRLEVAPA